RLEVGLRGAGAKPHGVELVPQGAQRSGDRTHLIGGLRQRRPRPPRPAVGATPEQRTHGRPPPAPPRPPPTPPPPRASLVDARQRSQLRRAAIEQRIAEANVRLAGLRARQLAKRRQAPYRGQHGDGLGESQPCRRGERARERSSNRRRRRSGWMLLAPRCW